MPPSEQIPGPSPVAVFWRVASEAPPAALAVLLMWMVVGSVLDGIGLLLLVPMLESLNAGAGSQSTLIQGLRTGFSTFGIAFSLENLLLIFCVLVILRSLISVLRVRHSTTVQAELVDKVRRRCYQALLHAQWRWLVAGRRSDHATTLMKEVDHLGFGLYMGIQLLAALVTMLAYLAVAFSLSWIACAVTLATGGLIFVLLKGLRREARDLGERMAQAERDLMGNVQESLAGIKLAKILGTEPAYLQRFDRHLLGMRNENLAFQINHTRATALYQTAGALMLAAFLYVGLKCLSIPMAALFTLVFIFSRLLPMFANSQQQYQQWLHAMPSVNRCYALIAEAEAAAEPLPDTQAPARSRIETGITLDNIQVRYQGREQAALDGIRLTLQARTTTAIMGESGAGKSTLADVLMGLLQPDSGSLRIDGAELQGNGILAWRRSVAYVPQDAFLFNDSIRQNLLLADANASEDDLTRALQRAAAEFVFELPQGLDTSVGDGGILLSGGERQRIALARALLKKPALLILDEATSALDTGNEARIRQAIENLHGDLTVVIIGHRLPTLEHADQVVVMTAGRIKAQGSWAEIAAAG